MLWFKKRTVTSYKAQDRIKNAIPNLVAILETEISKLDAFEGSKGSTTKVYTKNGLMKVLIAASNAQFKLKVSKVNPENASLVKYLGRGDEGFAASCVQIYSKIDNCKDDTLMLHITELHNTFAYLLFRVEKL